MHWVLILLLVCLFVALFLVLSVYLQLGYLLFVVERYCRSALFRFRGRAHLEQRLLALTIDDAPSRSHAPRILEILRAWHVKATFFIIGSYALENEDILREMVEQGHELGNHTMRDIASVKLDAPSLLAEIRETDRIISRAYEMARRPRPSAKWFRPGSGFYNKTVSTICAKEGYQIVLGSCHPFDAQIASAWWNSRHILCTVSPGDVIIVHDRPSTPALLESVLPRLKDAGYQFWTLSELSNV